MGKRSQNVIMENREKISVTGVIHVESFDMENVIVNTDLGVLKINGEDIRITSLDIDNGEVCVEGKIIGFEYKKENENWDRMKMMIGY
jgi:sporulation protein YabP